MIFIIVNQSIFIKSSFILPLFNYEMEQELKNLLKWIKTQSLEQELIDDIEMIITELISINSNLLSGKNFTELVNRYDCHRDYQRINPKIKISDPCFVCNGSYITANTAPKFYSVMHKIIHYIYSRNTNNDWVKYQFLYRLFCNLYSGIPIIDDTLE